MYTLTKKFRFEAAHRLAEGYVGKCANIHGHSWNGEICIAWGKSLNQTGISVDFSLLKEFVKIQIEDWLDHKILLFFKDEEIVELCKRNKFDFIVFSENPTCEVISRWIFNEAVNWFEKNSVDYKNGRFWIESVKIEETCTTSCTYTENV